MMWSHLSLPHDPHDEAASDLAAGNLQAPAAHGGRADVGGVNVAAAKLGIRVWGDDSVSHIMEGLMGIGEQRSVYEKLAGSVGLVNRPQGLGV